MKLIVLRHFQRYEDTSFYSSLTLEGFANSLVIVKRLERMGITHIYSSPYLRAIQTVFPFVEHMNDYGLKIRVEPVIGEMRNLQNFQPAHLFEKGINDIPIKYSPDLDWEYKSMTDTLHVERPESFEDVVERVLQFFHNLADIHELNDRILIVTHSSIVNAMKRIYNDTNNNDDVPHPYGELLEIDL